MTMVAGCAFRDGAVVIADSRATLELGAVRQFNDSLQKILPLGKRLAIGYAGHVATAGLIIQQLRKAISKNPRLEVPRRLAQELPRIARHYFKMQQGSAPPGRDTVGFVVAGINNAGNVSVWSFRSPTFEARQVVESFDVLGSGDIVKHRLRETFAQLIDLESLQKRANQLLMDLEGELAKRTAHTEDTVGGLFQVILVGQKGIQPLNYGFYDVDPQGPGYARSMRMESGQWIQSDLSGRGDVTLRRPLEFLRGFSGEQRVHDIRPPQPGGKIAAWYLQYFTTCREVKRDIGSTEVLCEMAAFTGFGYPRTIPVLVAASFWGPIGKHTVTIRLEAHGTVTEVHKSDTEVRYPLEPAELDIKVELHVERPGLGFLELLIRA